MNRHSSNNGKSADLENAEESLLAMEMSKVTSGQTLGNHTVKEPGLRADKRSYLYLTWLDFAESTTLHGLRFISMSNAFLVRRLFWFVLLILCVAIMSYQIMDRIIYYHGNPVNVNVKLNYNESLSFPSVTICNQNAFRASIAAEMDWYRLIESMYKGPLSQFDSRQLQNYNASQLPVDQLFSTAGHRKEDLIVKCEWGDELCGPENFTARLTDQGLCYTFNHETNRSQPLFATSTGSDHGLKLLLNVEQYEYMPGPTEAAGIKILIHDQYEYPRVRELGISVPAGTHAFVGLQVIVIDKLPPPHGTCHEVPLENFNKYTYDACILECTLKFYQRKCGCRDYYMPDSDHGGNPVCTLQQYIDCYSKVHEHPHCDCPSSCHYSLFDTTLSYATTSQYSTAKLVNTSRFKALKHKLTIAKETTDRMENAKFQEFVRIVEDVNQTYSSVQLLMQQELKEKIQFQLQQLNIEYEKMMNHWKLKYKFYQYQEYNVRKNFVRARDAMEERTFNHLCFDFHQFVYLLNAKMRSLTQSTFNNRESKDILYSLAINSIDNGISTSERALANFTKLYNSYENGTPIFNYKYPGIPRSHNKFSVPKKLLFDALIHNWYARKYAPRVGQDIKKLKDLLLDYKVLLNKTYDDGVIDAFQMDNISLTYIDACEDFFHSRSVFYFESVERPIRILSARRSKYDKTRLLYVESYNFILENLMHLQYSLSNISVDVLSYISNILEETYEYSTDNSVTKMQLVEIFANEELKDSLSLLKSFFFEVRNRGQNIYDGWTDLLTKTKSMWQPILEDTDMVEYYNYTKNFDYLASFAKLLKKLDSNFSDYRDENDLRFLVGNADSMFFDTYNNLQEHLQAFKASTMVDTTVLRENYLELDVFYRELNYEEIQQQVAYDLFALLCDIGGSMGLFVGASVMTIFELIDVVANLSAEKLLRTKT